MCTFTMEKETVQKGIRLNAGCPPGSGKEKPILSTDIMDGLARSRRSLKMALNMPCTEVAGGKALGSIMSKLKSL